MVRRTHGRGRLWDEGSTVVAVCTLRTNFCWNSGKYAELYNDLHDDAHLYPLTFLKSLIA